jgi:hypothetical protein
VLAERRGGVLLQLRDQPGFIHRRDGADAAKTGARHERPTLLLLRQIPVDRAAMQTEVPGNGRDRHAVLNGGHDALTEIEMIGTHTGLPPSTSIAPSQPLRKTL